MMNECVGDQKEACKWRTHFRWQQVVHEIKSYSISFSYVQLVN